MSRRYLYILALAMFLLAVSLITRHYYPSIPDFADGLIKGICIGLLLVVVFNLGKAFPKPDRKSGSL